MPYPCPHCHSERCVGMRCRSTTRAQAEEEDRRKHAEFERLLAAAHKDAVEMGAAEAFQPFTPDR